MSSQQHQSSLSTVNLSQPPPVAVPSTTTTTTTASTTSTTSARAYYLSSHLRQIGAIPVKIEASAETLKDELPHHSWMADFELVVEGKQVGYAVRETGDDLVYVKFPIILSPPSPTTEEGGIIKPSHHQSDHKNTAAVGGVTAGSSNSNNIIMNSSTNVSSSSSSSSKFQLIGFTIPKRFLVPVILPQDGSVPHAANSPTLGSTAAATGRNFNRKDTSAGIIGGGDTNTLKHNFNNNNNNSSTAISSSRNDDDDEDDYYLRQQKQQQFMETATTPSHASGVSSSASNNNNNQSMIGGSSSDKNNSSTNNNNNNAATNLSGISSVATLNKLLSESLSQRTSKDGKPLLCVVCGAWNTDGGQMRKSGFKCKNCIGIKSVARLKDAYKKLMVNDEAY